MAGWYKVYILSCCTLFVSMQFHWYGKHPEAYKKEHQKLFCKANIQRSIFTKKLHHQVSLALQIREQLNDLSSHNPLSKAA